jgi:hypothetical protein
MTDTSSGSTGAGIPVFKSWYSDVAQAKKRPVNNTTDVQIQIPYVYIEGIQVPCISLSVTQTYGALPTATVDIPPESGLLDITRGYQPKVHIFYDDPVLGSKRLLFWGVIESCTYARDRASGDCYVSYSCVHKNVSLKMALLDYSGWLGDTSTEVRDSEGAVRAGAFNSMESTVEALVGINKAGSAADDIVPGPGVISKESSTLDSGLVKAFDRLVGVPGCAINLWNQYKKYAYNDAGMNINVSHMIAPLVDESLAFFKRMSGHRNLEKSVQDGKESFCVDNNTGGAKVGVIPPAFQNPLLSATKSTMAATAIRSGVNFSGEYSDFISLLMTFLESIYYDLITLASPAEVSVSPEASAMIADFESGEFERIAVETIIKPQLPFYFSPVCNVLLPRMYSSINVMQQESAMPTRLLAYHSSDNTEKNLLIMRAPATVREATAYGALLRSTSQTVAPLLNLSDTFGVSYNVPGKYEQGTGIKPTKTALPWWLATMYNGQLSKGQSSEQIGAKGSPAYQEAVLLAADWEDRYAKNLPQEPIPGQDRRPINQAKKTLNPFNVENPTVTAFQRALLVALDYEYSRAYGSARQGTVEGVFNPYIIPGSPMDVIDDSPNHPCFHGMCTSVTHTFSPNGCATTIGMSAVTTFNELSNYYTPPVHPSIQTTLSVINGVPPASDPGGIGNSSGWTDLRSTLLQNPVAKEAADVFYKSVLGVGAAAPDELFDFKSGRVNGLQRASGVLFPLGVEQATKKASVRASNGGELNDYLTSVGNLRLVHRRVETKDAIEAKFDYTFIDLTEENYNEAVVKYLPPLQASGMLLEPGASMFLDYLETDVFVNLSKAQGRAGQVPATATPAPTP